MPQQSETQPNTYGVDSKTPLSEKRKVQPYEKVLFAQHINEEKKQVLIIRDTL
jgi:hypothetical protein